MSCSQFKIQILILNATYPVIINLLLVQEIKRDFFLFGIVLDVLLSRTKSIALVEAALGQAQQTVNTDHNT